MTTTGMLCVAALALRRRSTSMPSTLGILMSSSTSLGGREASRPAYAPVQKR